MSRARDFADLAGSADAGGITGKNLIINGAMQVAQRGTSFSGITDQYTLDRWTSSSAGGVSLNVSQQTATSTDNGYFASKHFARYQRNAVLSGFVYKVEDLQQFNNKTFTLSFWAKSADAGTTVTLTTYTVNDGSTFNSYVTQTYVTNPTLSSTWQKYEARLAFQDMYAYGYSGSHHLRLQFFDGSNAATFDISEVQLEVGEQATPFEHRSFGDELRRCQRYYQKSYNYEHAPGNTTNNGAYQFFHPSSIIREPNVRYETEMRVNPTETFYAPDSGTSGKVRNRSTNADETAVIGDTGSKGFNLSMSMTANNHYGFHYTADAEL